MTTATPTSAPPSATRTRDRGAAFRKFIGSDGLVKGTQLAGGVYTPYPARMEKRDPFKYFKTSREIIRLAVMLYVRFPLSLRNVEDLLHERGIDVTHEAVRYWWHRFGPMFAAEIKKHRIAGMKSSRWRWHARSGIIRSPVPITSDQ